MVVDLVKTDDTVLLVWGSNSPPVDLENQVNILRQKVGEKGLVQVEHESMLSQSCHAKSSFDVAFSGTVSSPYLHSDDNLAEILKIIKPNGYFVLRETKDDRPPEKLKSKLTISGFINISQLQATDKIVEIKCQKPNFEVGKATRLPLSFAKKGPKQDISKVWTLSDITDEVEIIDSDALLGEDDLIRPDLSSIKTDCGTSKAGKRKACKGCTCGLKEELNGEPAPAQKSACGSCYLGDAFRCASCPYLGMPPFKPGDQIVLSDRQLKPDT